MNNEQINIDPSEISKFENMAMRWWDESGEFKPLHDINPLRVNYIKQSYGVLKGKKILDVGCGGGILSEALAREEAIVTGIDMGENNLKTARLHLFESQLEVNYQHITVEELSEQQADHYDIVTCLEMLEHVPNPESIIHACSRLLKSDGHLFLSTLNRNPKSYLFGVIAAEYVLNLLPKGTHDYKKFIRPAELARWVRQSGCDVVDISGMRYNPFSSHCELSSDIDINYLLHAQKQ